jgi:YHS domain-containing protein
MDTNRTTVGRVIVLLLASTLLFGGCKKEKPAPRPAAQPAPKTTQETPAQPQAQGAKDTLKAAVAQAVEQTTCPVMGGPIDKAIFTEYQGKKVYFCCKECQAKFTAAPVKYLAKLPQFQMPDPNTVKKAIPKEMQM